MHKAVVEVMKKVHEQPHDGCDDSRGMPLNGCLHVNRPFFTAIRVIRQELSCSPDCLRPDAIIGLEWQDLSDQDLEESVLGNRTLVLRSSWRRVVFVL